MADIGGFPVHNYGSDPLGRMGIEMFKSSLDWDEKQKELERRATIEAATQQRGAFMETVKGGTAPPGVASKLYGSEIGGGVDRLSQQNQVTEELKRLTGIIKMNTDQQTYTEKQITSIEDAQGKLMKRKLELMDAGGQDDMVVYMNDQLKAMDAKVSQLRGFNIGSSVTASDLSSWKTTKQEEATKQIAALGTELKTAMGAKEPDSEAIGAASAKLQAAITTMQQKWKLPKENFTLEATLLKKADEAMKQVVVAKLSPPKPPTPTNEDKAILDRLATLGLPPTPENRDRVRTILANEPNKARETALVSNTAFISKVLKIPEQEAIHLALKTKDSEGTVSDINKLGTMLESLATDKNPSKWKIALIEKTAEKLGWNLVKVDPKTKPGEYLGTVWPTTIEEGGYSLEPKKTKGTTESLLKGKKEGQYRVNGVIVNWDGSKVIP